jgi:hypothetical protein
MNCTEKVLNDELNEAANRLLDKLEDFFKSQPEKLEEMLELQPVFNEAVKCKRAFYNFMTLDNQPSAAEFYGYKICNEEFE